MLKTLFKRGMRMLGLFLKEDVVHMVSDAVNSALEEKKWELAAAMEAERKEIEHERALLDHDYQELKSFAMQLGVPVVEQQSLH